MASAGVITVGSFAPESSNEGSSYRPMSEAPTTGGIGPVSMICGLAPQKVKQVKMLQNLLSNFRFLPRLSKNFNTFTSYQIQTSPNHLAHMISYLDDGRRSQQANIYKHFTCIDSLAAPLQSARPMQAHHDTPMQLQPGRITTSLPFQP